MAWAGHIQQQHHHTCACLSRLGPGPPPGAHFEARDSGRTSHRSSHHQLFAPFHPPIIRHPHRPAPSFRARPRPLLRPTTRQAWLHHQSSPFTNHRPPGTNNNNNNRQVNNNHSNNIVTHLHRLDLNKHHLTSPSFNWPTTSINPAKRQQSNQELAWHWHLTPPGARRPDANPAAACRLRPARPTTTTSQQLANKTAAARRQPPYSSISPRIRPRPIRRRRRHHLPPGPGLPTNQSFWHHSSDIKSLAILTTSANNAIISSRPAANLVIASQQHYY